MRFINIQTNRKDFCLMSEKYVSEDHKDPAVWIEEGFENRNHKQRQTNLRWTPCRAKTGCQLWGNLFWGKSFQREIPSFPVDWPFEGAPFIWALLYTLRRYLVRCQRVLDYWSPYCLRSGSFTFYNNKFTEIPRLITPIINYIWINE